MKNMVRVSLPLVGRARVGVSALNWTSVALTPPPPTPPHRNSGVPELRERKPISGRPEIGGEEGCRRFPGQTLRRP
jgi:hypothetical protein